MKAQIIWTQTPGSLRLQWKTYKERPGRRTTGWARDSGLTTAYRKFIWNHGAILHGSWHWYRTEAAMGTVGTKMELYLLQIALKAALFCHCVFEQAGSETEIQIGPRLSRSRSSQPVLKPRTFVIAWNTSRAVGALQPSIYRIFSKQFWTRTKAKFVGIWFKIVGSMSAQPGSHFRNGPKYHSGILTSTDAGPNIKHKWLTLKIEPERMPLPPAHEMGWNVGNEIVKGFNEYGPILIVYFPPSLLAFQCFLQWPILYD